MWRKDFKDNLNEKDNKETTIPLGEILSSMKNSQVLYPIMQCVDIFFLNNDICSLGID